MATEQNAVAESAAEHKEEVGKESEIYTKRFSSQEEQVRHEVWKVLCADYFQQFVPENGSVLDLGAGDGQFIRNIKARRRVAVDIMSDVQRLADDGIEVHCARATELTQCVAEPVDAVFMSNFLEHLPDKHTLLAVLAQCCAILNTGGRIMVLQPNIRYVGPAYWDYIDHHIALTEHSLTEALEISGFKVETLVPRFLPYTAKSTLGHVAARGGAALFMRWYLRLPFCWRVFGAQTFVTAAKSQGADTGESA